MNACNCTRCKEYQRQTETRRNVAEVVDRLLRSDQLFDCATTYDVYRSPAFTLETVTEKALAS